MREMKIGVKLLHPDALLPKRLTNGACAVDLASVERVTLNPGERKGVGTGIAIEIPIGFEGQIRARSGLAFKNGIGVLNSPGTIDADYRGEIKVILVNHGTVPYTVEVRDRIAQLVIAEAIVATFEPMVNLSATDRGDGGFGHTGR